MAVAQLWIRISLINLILAAITGLILRVAFVQELLWLNYTKAMHAHSHMAMLGWGYLVVFALIYYIFRHELAPLKKTIQALFILLQIAALGMFICFPLFGYGIPTVSFLTAHMILSYIFIILVWRHIPKGNAYADNYWLKGALIFLVLSTIGVWVIAPIFMFDLGRSIWYYLAVQFFLHFEINAWFLFAAMGLFFILLRRAGIMLERRKMKYVFYLFFVSCILTYALAVAWSKSGWLVITVNTLGVLMQTGGAALLFYLLWPERKKILNFHSGYAKPLFILASLAFLSKIIIQLMLVLPAFMEVAYTIRNLIVGFIHLILLGIFTPYVFAFIKASGLFNYNKVAKAGVGIFIAGFIFTELVIFIQGGMFWMAWGFMPAYYQGLMIGTILLPAGLIMIFLGMKKSKSIKLAEFEG